ncbi:MAG TPA: hypothetical protein DDY14_17035 [Chromatiaceae bacterium]|nr:hypothetical protein [Chromatiaceae bacterium]
MPERNRPAGGGFSFAFANAGPPIAVLWAGCYNVDAGREDKPGGLFLHSNRLNPFWTICWLLTDSRGAGNS